MGERSVMKPCDSKMWEGVSHMMLFGSNIVDACAGHDRDEGSAA